MAFPLEKLLILVELSKTFVGFKQKKKKKIPKVCNVTSFTQTCIHVHINYAYYSKII